MKKFQFLFQWFWKIRKNFRVSLLYFFQFQCKNFIDDFSILVIPSINKKNEMSIIVKYWYLTINLVTFLHFDITPFHNFLFLFVFFLLLRNFLVCHLSFKTRHFSLQWSGTAVCQESCWNTWVSAVLVQRVWPLAR